MEKMSLIVGLTTGHVLGACTRTADPEGALTPEQLVGAGLLVRAAAPAAINEPTVIVQPQHLKIESVDRRDDVILSHRNYVLEDGLPTERGALAAAPLAYNAGTRILTVNLPNPAPEDLEVWVQIEDEPSQPIVVVVEVAETDPSGTASVTLATGNYPVLVLAPGYRAFLGILNVP